MWGRKAVTGERAAFTQKPVDAPVVRKYPAAVLFNQHPAPGSHDVYGHTIPFVKGRLFSGGAAEWAYDLDGQPAYPLVGGWPPNQQYTFCMPVPDGGQVQYVSRQGLSAAAGRYTPEREAGTLYSPAALQALIDAKGGGFNQGG